MYSLAANCNYRMHDMFHWFLDMIGNFISSFERQLYICEVKKHKFPTNIPLKYAYVDSSGLEARVCGRKKPKLFFK